jgi:hypothetical protein
MISFQLSLDQSKDSLNVPFLLTKNQCFKKPYTFIRGFMHASKPSKAYTSVGKLITALP